MFHKLIVFYRSGGFVELSTYILARIKRLLYYRSETIFLFLEREKFESAGFEECELEFRVIDCVTQMNEIDFPRLKLLPYNVWLEKGSYAIVGVHMGKCVSYTWTHFGSHRDVSLVQLRTDQCWTGPAFVDKRMRNRGINKCQKVFQIRSLPTHISWVLTSVNAKNSTSLQANVRLGFKQGLRCVRYSGFFSSKKVELHHLGGPNGLISLL